MDSWRACPLCIMCVVINMDSDDWKQRGHELDEHRRGEATIFVVPVKDTVEKKRKGKESFSS